MGRTYLDWIDDEDLETEVKRVIKSYKKSLLDNIQPKKFHSNVIDPFDVMFKTSIINQSTDEWINQELVRQTQKTLANAIGEFHQSLIGHCEGWEYLENDVSELDLRGEINGEIIYVELKNKHNTMNTSSRKTVFSKLLNAVDTLKADRAMLVEILPHKHPYPPKLWDYKPKGGIKNTDKRIQIVSGNFFYSFVTGYSEALRDLYQVLPQIIRLITSSEEDLSVGELNQELLLGQTDRQYDDIYGYFFSIAFSTDNSE